MFRSITLACVLICALSAPTTAYRSARIIGGGFANQGEYPYHAAIYNGRDYTCGGSILSETVILTAGNCIYGHGVSSFTVRVGSNNVNQGTGHRLKDFLFPDEFHYESDYDIALMILRNPIQFNENVKPIALPSKDEKQPSNVEATVTGWGFFDLPSYDIPDQLKFAKVSMFDTSECKKSFPEITNKQICAGDTSGHQEACGGDNGGPLVYNGKVYGIVDWRVGCDKSLGTYTSVIAFRDWIAQEVQL